MDKINLYYSRGMINFEELIALIHGAITMEQLEQERNWI